MRICLISIAVMIVLSVPAAGICEESTGNFNFAVGALWTADDFSESVNMDNKMEIGVNCDVRKKSWPVSIAFEYMLSYGRSKTSANQGELQEDMNVDVYCSETYVGVRKVFNHFSSVRPFVGCGICSVNMYVDTSYNDDHDAGVGVWIGAGTYFRLSRRWDIGLEWRWSRAEVNILGREFDAGGNHVDLMIGHHF